MIIPHHTLSPEALQGLIEDFATRDGTDYGQVEVDLTQKVDEIRRQLEKGEIVICFNSDDGSCNLMPADAVPASPHEST
jgi:uncharacterized protein YheU (UPF0270 family)